MMPSNGSTSNGTNICQGSNKRQTYQQWNITPVDMRVGGDFSYFYISNVKNGAQLDINNWSTSNGASIILYAGGKGANEQWYFQYAGDGYYYIQHDSEWMISEVQTDISLPNIKYLRKIII